MIPQKEHANAKNGAKWKMMLFAFLLEENVFIFSENSDWIDAFGIGAQFVAQPIFLAIISKEIFILLTIRKPIQVTGIK